MTTAESGTDSGSPLTGPQAATTSAVTTSRVPWPWRMLPALGACVAAGLITAVGLRHNMEAPFGPIDDHEPLRWLTGGDRLLATDALSTLLSGTEVGDFGDTPRFRPAYYAIRVGEAVILGDNPAAWYLVVALAFAATVALFGYTATLWLEKALGTPRSRAVCAALAGYAAFATILFGTLTTWAGIVTRLGPSELWALLGTALAALAMTHLALGKGAGWWVPALAGTTVAVWSKETFLPLALVPIGIGIYRSREFTHRRSDWLLGLGGLVPAAVLIVGVAPSLLSRQGDVYGQDIDGSRAATALDALMTTYLLYWAPSVILLLLASLSLLFIPGRSSMATSTLCMYLVVVAVTWLGLDGFIYDGDYLLPRYLAVSQTLKITMLLGALALSLGVARRARGFGRVAALIVLSASVLVAGSLTRAAPQALQELATESRANATAAIEYQEGVRIALQSLQGVPSPRVLLVTQRDVDFEPTVAIATDVTRTFPQARVSVVVPDGVAAPSVSALSQEGGNEWNIVPLTEFPRGTPDMCIFLNADPELLIPCDPSTSARVDARAI